MANQVFNVGQTIGSGVAPQEITDPTRFEFNYWASILQNGGVTADTFVEFAGRFALLCDGAYGGSDFELTVDAAHPKITIVCEELDQILKEQPGDRIPTPADVDLFRELFKTANTVDLVIKPAEFLPEMPHTFAKVSWERTAACLIDFYAQGGDTVSGRALQEALYERMFYVAESAPRKGIDVALGISAAKELRRYGVGSEQFNSELRGNFDFISRKLGRPTSDYYLDKPKPSTKGRLRNAIGLLLQKFAR